MNNASCISVKTAESIIDATATATIPRRVVSCSRGTITQAGQGAGEAIQSADSKHMHACQVTC